MDHFRWIARKQTRNEEDDSRGAICAESCAAAERGWLWGSGGPKRWLPAIGVPPVLIPGWWFGCHFFFIYIGNVKKSQLTKSYFSGWGGEKPPTRSILVRFSPINQPFWGTPIYGNHQMDPNGLFYSPWGWFQIWGFPARHGGTPNWMVFLMENPHLKWMMTGGTPMTQETSILSL